MGRDGPQTGTGLVCSAAAALWRGGGGGTAVETDRTGFTEGSSEVSVLLPEIDT